MSMPQRRDVPPEVHALADANAALRADKACLEWDNVNLKALNVRLEQRIRAMQVIVALLLAITLGLAVGMTASMTGSSVQAALGSATGVFFAVIMTSIAVLSYIRR